VNSVGLTSGFPISFRTHAKKINTLGSLAVLKNTVGSHLGGQLGGWISCAARTFKRGTVGQLPH
jgi:hypothetical protein